MKRLKLNIQLFAEDTGTIKMGVLSVDTEMNATKFRAGVNQVINDLNKLTDKADASFAKLKQSYKTEGTRANGLRTAIKNVRKEYDELAKAAQKLSSSDKSKIKSNKFDSLLQNTLSGSKTKLSSLGAENYQKIKDPKILANILDQYKTEYTKLSEVFVKEVYNQANAFDKLEAKEQANHNKEMARLEKQAQKAREAAEAEAYRQSVLKRFQTIGNSGLANNFFQKAYADSIAQVTDEKVKESLQTRIVNAQLAEEEEKVMKEVLARKKLAQIIEQNSTHLGRLKNIIKGLNNVQDKASNGFSKFINGLKSRAVTIRIVGGVIRQVWSQLANMFEEAAGYVESVNLYTIALGEYAEQGTKWANKISTALYLDPKDIMQYTGAFYNLVEGLGVASDKAYTMATNLTQLTYDMSSYLNIDVESAQAKIQSAITGQSRAVASAGIAMQQATLQELAYSMGIKKAVGEMTQAEKTYLRYIQIMRSTANMQGDLARTIITPENAVRVLKNQFTLLARAIGNVFIPIIMKAIPYVMALTKILQDLATRIASFLGVEIGWSSSEIDYSGLKLADTYLEDVGDTATGTSNKVGKAVKKIEDELGNLASFDQLNVITFNDDTSTGSGGTGGVGGVGGGSILPQLEDAISGYDMLQGLTSEFDKQVKNATENLDKLKNIAKTILGIWIAWKAVKLANSLLDFAESVKRVLTFLSPLLKIDASSFKGILTGLGKLAVAVTALVVAGKSLNNIHSNIKSDSLETLKTGKEVNNMFDDSLSTFDELDKQVLKVSGSLAVLGGIIGGPVGAVVGFGIGEFASMASALHASSSAMEEYMNSFKEYGETLVYGDVVVSQQEWVKTFDSLHEKSLKFMNSLNELNSSINSHGSEILNAENQLDSLAFKYGTTGAKISNEDSKKIMNALETITSESIAMIDDNVEKGLLLYKHLFEGGADISEEEQKRMLNNVIQYGEDQKAQLKEAQNNITRTYNNAIKTRGYLTDEEYKYIQKQLADIRRLTEQEMNKNQQNIEYYKKLFADKNAKLDEESLRGFLTAYENYNTEYEKMLEDTYTETIALLKKQYGEESAEYKKYSEEAYRQRKEDSEHNKAVLKEVYDDVIRNAKATYAELLSSSDATKQAMAEGMKNTFKDLNIDVSDIEKQVKKAGEDSSKWYVQGWAGTKLDLTIDGDTSGLTKSVASSVKTIQNALSKLGIKTPPGAAQLLSSYAGKFTSHFASISARLFAEGGYPDSGDLFFANENGVPEYITSIGNKSAVVNQQQMVTALTNAIVEGLSNMNTPQSNEPVNIYIGNDKVYSGFINYAKRQNNIYGTNVIRV